jgi:hypothetical protein
VRQNPKFQIPNKSQKLKFQEAEQVAHSAFWNFACFVPALFGIWDF